LDPLDPYPRPRTNTTLPTSKPSSSSGILSTGAKADIGINVSLGVLAIIGVVGLCFLIMKRAGRSQTPSRNEIGDETERYQIDFKTSYPELPAHERSQELDANEVMPMAEVGTEERHTV
jgi:hypothetical protein